MTGAEFQTRALGYPRLRIETEAFNTSAHGFYDALGYTETRRFIGDVIGFEMPCLKMTKALGGAGNNGYRRRRCGITA